MTEDEREALQWLDVWMQSRSAGGSKHSTTIKRLLAQPRMPEEPTDAMLAAMWAGDRFGMILSDQWREAYAALRAELSKPPEPETREIDVWRVEFAMRHPTADGPGWLPCVYEYTARSKAEEHAADLTRDAWPKACITVTGPHRQRVPA